MSNLWGPGAWADEADQEAAEAATKANETVQSGSSAVSGKSKKKNKGQTLTLAEFATGVFVGPGGRNHSGGAAVASVSNGLTTDELLMLPKGPRERSGDEQDYGGSGRLGGGFRDYGRSVGGSGRSFRDEGDGQRGSERKSHTRANDFEPSRADEVENWATAKKAAPPPPGHTRANDLAPSRADEVENWAMAKKVAPAPPVNSYNRSNRERYDAHGPRRSRADEVDNWAARKRTGSLGSTGAERWGNRRGGGFSSAMDRERERLRLVLNPPSRPRNNALDVSDVQQVETAKLPLSNVLQLDARKPKQKPNPFGSARPREEVLSKRGEDWKKLEAEIQSRSTNRLASFQWKKLESEIEIESRSSECSRLQSEE